MSNSSTFWQPTLIIEFGQQCGSVFFALFLSVLKDTTPVSVPAHSRHRKCWLFWGIVRRLTTKNSPRLFVISLTECQSGFHLHFMKVLFSTVNSFSAEKLSEGLRCFESKFDLSQNLVLRLGEKSEKKRGFCP